MKGITPVIAIILLLIIVVAMVGVGYGFIAGLFPTITSKVPALAGASCIDGVAHVFVRNVGDDTINITTSLLQTEPYRPDGNTRFLMHLDEGTGSTPADSSGNGNDGTFQGTVEPQWVAGRFGTGVGTDRDDQSYVHAPHHPVLDRTGLVDWTVEGWIRTTATDPEIPLLSKHVLLGPIGYSLSVDGTTGQAVFEVNNNAEANSGTVANLGNGDWHHIAGVYEDQTQAIHLYVDGVLVDTQTGVVGANGIDLGLGATLSPLGYGSSEIDELRISDVARDFADPALQGWNYICPPTDGEYRCGDILVSKSEGSGSFSPGFDKPEILPGETVLFKDGDCQDNCVYRFVISPAPPLEARVRC